MKKTISLCGIAVMYLLLVFCQDTVQQSNEITADLIITNAKVAVMDVNNTFTEAIAVRNGQVLATGTNTELLALQGDSTKVLDAEGRTLIPGLNDSHLHLTRGGRFYNAELR